MVLAQLTVGSGPSSLRPLWCANDSVCVTPPALSGLLVQSCFERFQVFGDGGHCKTHTYRALVPILLEHSVPLEGVWDQAHRSRCGLLLPRAPSLSQNI
jgi:hypothetical protein